MTVEQLSNHPKFKRVRDLSRTDTRAETICRDLLNKTLERDQQIIDVLDNCIKRMDNHNDQFFKDKDEEIDDLAYRVSKNSEDLYTVIRVLSSWMFSDLLVKGK